VLRVGTRGSPLALIQTRGFIKQISEVRPALGGVKALEEEIIRTTGDAVQDRRLADIGGKGLFAKEIHEALLDRRVDFAVHSLKDLETAMPDGIVLGCVLRREDPRDALVLGHGRPASDAPGPFGCLPEGARVGTASLRRQAQLLHHRPDIRVGLLRGSVQTRLAKIEAGEYDAAILALAGLRRLGLEQHASVIIDPDVMVPAVGQGIVGVTARAGDAELLALLAAIEDSEAKAVATAERALLASLDGTCHTPIGGYAQLLPDGGMRLTGLVATPDGSFHLRRELIGAPADAGRLGQELGASLRADSPRTIFD
jgi:hydroxymethylbilane synthase